MRITKFSFLKNLITKRSALSALDLVIELTNVTRSVDILLECSKERNLLLWPQQTWRLHGRSIRMKKSLANKSPKTNSIL